jgi:hypothetical protein
MYRVAYFYMMPFTILVLTYFIEDGSKVYGDRIWNQNLIQYQQQKNKTI